MARSNDEAAEEVRGLAAELAAKVRDLEAFARRAALLPQVTAALAGATTVQDVADVVTAHGHPLFGSTAALLFLLTDDGRTLELCACAGAWPGHAEPPRRLAIDGDEPLADAVRTDTPLWIGAREALLARYPGLGAGHEGAPLVGMVVLPLHESRRVIGGLAFAFDHEAALGPVERDFFRTLASMCGQALERARTFAAMHRANVLLETQQERLAVLARAAEALAAPLDSRNALAELTRLVVPTLADWVSIYELGPHGELRCIAIEHRDPAKVVLAARLAERHPPRHTDPHGVAAVLRTGVTEWVPDIPDALLVGLTHDAEHLELVRSLGLISYASVPLMSRGRVLGALTLVTEGTRRLREDDLRFAEELGRHAALALENARLYETAEAARAQLHGLFMHAPAAISLLRGPELRFELANGPYRERAGCDDLVGRPLREALPWLVEAGVVTALERVYTTGETFKGSEVAVDGRHYNIVVQATRDGAGTIDGIATFAFEITDQIAARRELEALAAEVARSEGRMRALIGATAVVMWTATAEGQIVEISESWLAFTGQTAQEYLGLGFLAALHPDDRASTLHLWLTAVAAGAPYATEYRLRRAGGGYSYVLARGMPVLHTDGSVAEYIGCNIDVSELRHAEADAREHAETVSTLHELGQVIAAELDQQKVVQAVTDAATRLTDAQFGAFFYNVLDDSGERYMLFTISGAPREAFAHFPKPRNTAVSVPTFAGTAVVRSDDITKDPRYGQNAPFHGMPAGHLPVRSYLAVPVISRSGAVLGGIFLGHPQVGVFSERAEALAVGLAAQAAVAMDNAHLYGDARRLIKALEATNRALDQFAYITSHDLRAPLRGIGSLAEWIEEDLGPALDDGVQHKLGLLRRRVLRMEALIQGILDFSRAGRNPDQLEHVDVRALVLEVVELLAPPPTSRVEIEGELPVLHTSRVALQQVLMNLVGNGLKHAVRPDAHVRIGARTQADGWELYVADNGPGIAPEYQERVWGIFQTLESRDKVENTGIGLAIVRKIVEGRGGVTRIESPEGQGATFRVTWPDRDARRT